MRGAGGGVAGEKHLEECWVFSSHHTYHISLLNHPMSFGMGWGVDQMNLWSEPAGFPYVKRQREGKRDSPHTVCITKTPWDAVPSSLSQIRVRAKVGYV